MKNVNVTRKVIRQGLTVIQSLVNALLSGQDVFHPSHVTRCITYPTDALHVVALASCYNDMTKLLHIIMSSDVSSVDKGLELAIEGS